MVVAPTSVCANWVAEAERFAPRLRVRWYGESERASKLEGVGPYDLIIASYALAQIDVGSFAQVEWAKLVLDEAQALQNAGTPVENRLADL